MSHRLITKFLPKSYNSLQMFKKFSVYNLNKSILPIHILPYNLVYNTPSRLFSEQTKLEEMIVDYDYVKKAASEQKILLIDVREPDEIKEHGKIPNSINIPLGNVSTALNSLSDKEFEQTYGIKKPTEDTEIIFYCMIGKRSGMAQQNALSFGYKKAKNYVGSFTDWASKCK